MYFLELGRASRGSAAASEIAWWVTVHNHTVTLWSCQLMASVAVLLCTMWGRVVCCSQAIFDCVCVAATLDEQAYFTALAYVVVYPFDGCLTKQTNDE